jgi:cathepsin F
MSQHQSFSISIDQANIEKKSSGIEVPQSEEEVMKAYVNFIATYGKQYGTKAHASKKYDVFKQNY